MSTAPEPGQRLERSFDTETAGILRTILSKVLAIQRDRRRARALLPSLPELRVDVPLPGSKQIFDWIEQICSTPHRRPGTPEGNAAERWVVEQFNELGLQDVTLDPIPLTVWTADRWSLSVEGQILPCFFVLNTAFTGPQGVTAPLRYVGTGRKKDFEGQDIRDAIVVAEVPFPYLPIGALMRLAGASYAVSDPDHSLSLLGGQRMNFVRRNFLGGTDAQTAPERDVYWRAVRRGAAGICLILRDQPGDSNSHYGPYDGIEKPIPGLWLGKRDGRRLQALARRNRIATLTLEGRAEPGTMHNVWATLPGQSDETILITSHHDSPFKGAVEDGAGVAQVLAQARAWSRVPAEQRPRSLVFVVSAGHFHGSAGGHGFAREHADLMQRTRILITLEHLAAKEVAEQGRRYAETGRACFTVMFTSPEPPVIASVMRTLQRKRPKNTAAIPSNLLAPAPTSDAAGYVLESGVPVISWIGCPYYLLDEFDTLDKVDRTELVPIAETVTELVKTHMVL